MDVLVAYDVSTETRDGRRRLRRVAIVCKDFGQRVQYSVFECKVNEDQYESLKARLLDVMNGDEDSLRIYRLRSPREETIECYERDSYVSYNDPLVF